MLTCCYVALGSALGGALRYLVSRLALRVETVLPLSAVWSTVLINVLGSFVIGFVGTATAHGSRMPLSNNARLFLMAGICGGFTTFSAFSLQTFDLLRHGSPWRAALNVIASVALCLAAVAAGHHVGQGQTTIDAVIQTEVEDRAV